MTIEKNKKHLIIWYGGWESMQVSNKTQKMMGVEPPENQMTFTFVVLDPPFCKGQGCPDPDVASCIFLWGSGAAIGSKRHCHGSHRSKA